jgi:hypothetical protein
VNFHSQAQRERLLVAGMSYPDDQKRVVSFNKLS